VPAIASGITYTQARAKLSAARCSFGSRVGVRSEVGLGLVVRFSYAPGRVLTGATPVNIVVSDGQCVVPTIGRGEKKSSVQDKLYAAGCQPGKVSKKYSSKVRRGRVIKLLTRAGTVLENGASIGIQVSKGPKRR
jgi:serine/threonine-protein kinase